MCQWPDLRLFKTNLFRSNETIASQTRLPIKHQSQLEWLSPLGLAQLPACSLGARPAVAHVHCQWGNLTRWAARLSLGCGSARLKSPWLPCPRVPGSCQLPGVAPAHSPGVVPAYLSALFPHSLPTWPGVYPVSPELQAGKVPVAESLLGVGLPEGLGGR